MHLKSFLITLLLFSFVIFCYLFGGSHLSDWSSGVENPSPILILGVLLISLRCYSRMD